MGIFLDKMTKNEVDVHLLIVAPKALRLLQVSLLKVIERK